MTQYETISLPLPAEPAEGSVVIGKSGRAYQCWNSGNDSMPYWYSSKAMDHSMNPGVGNAWAFLILTEAPLKVVYRKELDKMEIEGKQE